MSKKKGGGKKKAAADDENISPADQCGILKAQVESLQQRLILEHERTDKSNSKLEEINENELKLNAKLDEQKAETAKCVDEMTKQY